MTVNPILGIFSLSPPVCAVDGTGYGTAQIPGSGNLLQRKNRPCGNEIVPCSFDTLSLTLPMEATRMVNPFEKGTVASAHRQVLADRKNYDTY